MKRNTTYIKVTPFEYTYTKNYEEEGMVAVLDHLST
jgi:hypothetical protein